MRPTTVLSLVAAVVLGLGGVVLGAWIILDHHAMNGSKWHYWLAPLLMIGAALTLWQLTVAYMVKVGRYELRGRPPAE